MNQAEKIELYKSQRYYDMVQMQLFQWLRYWIETGPDTITHDSPEEQAKLIENTKKVIEQILSNSDRVVRRVMIIAINDPRVNEIAALTQTDLKPIINSVMSSNLPYVLGDGNIY